MTNSSNNNDIETATSTMSLNKEQVNLIVEEVLRVQEIDNNKKTRRVMIAFGSMFLLMTTVLIGTTYTSVKLAEDVRADPKTGSLISTHGNNQVIATQNVGLTVSGDVQYDPDSGRNYMCVGANDAYTIWDTMTTGGQASFLAHENKQQGENSDAEGEVEYLLPLKQSGTMMNETHICFGGTSTTTSNESDGDDSGGSQSLYCIEKDSNLCDSDNRIDGNIGDNSNNNNRGRRLKHRELAGSVVRCIPGDILCETMPSLPPTDCFPAFLM